ncbi:C-X-C chemokine receptor type 6 [Gastrophryne carolinensis]
MQMESVTIDYSDYFNEGNNATNQEALFRVFVPVAYAITCAAGLPGNALVIIVFLFYEKKRTLSNMFFINLASADILFLCMLPFLAHYSHTLTWIFGGVMCKVVRAMYRINLYTAMLTLTAITIDRFISIVIVTKAQSYQQRKHKWGGALCAMTWLLALVLSAPQLIFSQISGGHCIDHYSPKVEMAVLSFQLTVGFLAPLSAMLVCYAFIIKTLIHSRSSQKKKSIRIIITLVLVFIATQLPFNITSLIDQLMPNNRSLTAAIVTEAIAYIHACLNPILYIFVGSKFRKNFLKMLRIARSWKETSTAAEASSKCPSASTNMEAISLQQS